jgi:predicted  nucleic acid-binding Zn-ribbon protein
MQEAQAVAPMTSERQAELEALKGRISETEARINRLKGEISHLEDYYVRPLKLSIKSATSAEWRNRWEISLQNYEPQLFAKNKELSDLDGQLRGLCAQRAEITAL